MSNRTIARRFLVAALAFAVLAMAIPTALLAAQAKAKPATLNFWDAAEDYPTTFVERMTEVTVPPRRLDASGFYLGLRTGFRF